MVNNAGSVGVYGWTIVGGSMIGGGILSWFACDEYVACMNRATDLDRKAAKTLEPCKYLEWHRAVKPGSECGNLGAICGGFLLQTSVSFGTGVNRL